MAYYNHMSKKKMMPILTIAIPTFNRSEFLKLSLKQLQNEIKLCPKNSVELLISDNASDDDTQLTIKYFQDSGMNINVIKNQENIGPDKNIAQCFNLAKGHYVLILGDDDLLLDGVLSLVINILKIKNYGVVFLKSYGYDHDFRKENPDGKFSYKEYSDPEAFIEKCSHLMTFISGFIINKRVLRALDANQFCGSNLVQVNLFLTASLSGINNLFISSYSVACKRNNSGGYDFSSVFVTNFFDILDSYNTKGLTKSVVANIENRLIICFYPFFLLKLRLNRDESCSQTFDTFQKRFGRKLLFKILLAPIFLQPRPIALVFGALITVVGRVYVGDFRRGVCFFVNKLKHKW